MTTPARKYAISKPHRSFWHRPLTAYLFLLCMALTHTVFAAPSKKSATQSIDWTYAPKKGLTLNLRSKDLWQFRVGTEVFVRPELQGNRSDLLSTRDDSDFYTVVRTRLLLEMKMNRWLGARAIIQDARFWGNGLPGGGKIRFNSQNNSAFQRELFLGTSFYEALLFIDRPQGMPFRLEMGRLQLIYGYSFFVGDPAYIPQGQSFDGARLRLYWKGHTTDLLWVKVRESVERAPQTGCGEQCEFEGDDWAGLYHTFRFSKQNALDLYGFVYRRAPRKQEPNEMSTIGIFGARFERKTKRLFLTVEGIFEGGRHRQQALLAFAGLAYLKYTLTHLSTRPFFGAQFMVGSGDGDQSDDTDNNFLPLFSNRRRFYGALNMFGPSNIIQPSLFAGFSPYRTITLKVDARYTWKWSPNSPLVGGGSHNPFLAVPSSAESRRVGWEASTMLIWKPHATLMFDISGGVFLPDGQGVLQALSQQQSQRWGTDPAWLGYVRAWLRF